MYYTIQAGIGDQMHYVGVPRCVGRRAHYRLRSEALRIFQKVTNGHPVRNASLDGTAWSFSGPTFTATWARIVGQSGHVIEEWGTCPPSLDLPWTEL
jgi:hypothetical protein